MRAFCFRLALLAFASVALAPASADAQERFRMRVTLGTPPEFDVDLQYFDPSDLFARVKGSRVMPFWVSARNVLPARSTAAPDAPRWATPACRWCDPARR